MSTGRNDRSLSASALRGLAGGLIAGGVGARLMMSAFARRRPVWLTRLLGEGEESE